jgi:ribosomal protein S18 acetylase RimI-like enzyme
METKIRIRLAQREDLNAVVALWKELMDLTAEVNPRYRLRVNAEDQQRAIFSEYIRRSDAYVIVGEAAGRIVSFSNGYLTMPAKTFAQSVIGVLENLLVVEDYRRRGIGRETATKAIAWLGRQGAMEIYVNVIPKNVGSLKFWRAMGFEVQRLAMFKEL